MRMFLISKPITIDIIEGGYKPDIYDLIIFYKYI